MSIRDEANFYLRASMKGHSDEELDWEIKQAKRLILADINESTTSTAKQILAAAEAEKERRKQSQAQWRL